MSPRKPPPPWRAKNAEERRAMIRWILDELDAMDHEDLSKQNPDVSYPDMALAAAHDGEIEPLRSAYPKLAQFIHLSKVGRGKHKRPLPERWLMAATRDVERVRALWKRTYDRKNRQKDDGPSAEEIVARRWVDILDGERELALHEAEEEIRKALKKPNRYHFSPP